MLKDEDRIFKNLYNDFGWDIDSSECWKYRTWVIAHAEQELLLSEKENQE